MSKTPETPEQLVEAFQGASSRAELDGLATQAPQIGYQVPKDLPTPGMTHRLVGIGLPALSLVINPDGEHVDQAILLP